MTPIRRLLGLVAVALALGACDIVTTEAPSSSAPRTSYVAPGAPSFTLITVINNESETGAHTALLIDGAERLLWDPAGSWYNPGIQEQGDVHFGLTPAFFDYYIDYHARESFRVVTQRVEVTPEQAALMSQMVLANGPAARATCSRTTSTMLSQVPGFEAVSTNWFPMVTMAQFGRIPGVVEQVIYDDDGGSNSEILTAQHTATAGQVTVAQATAGQ